MRRRPILLRARSLLALLTVVVTAIAFGCHDKPKPIPTKVDCGKVENCYHLACWLEPACQVTDLRPPGGCKPGQVKDIKSQACRDCTSDDCDGLPSFCCASSACSDSVACGLYICKEIGSDCSGVTSQTCGYHDLDEDDAWGDCDEAPSDPCCLCKIGIGCVDSPCKLGQYVRKGACDACSKDTCEQLPCMGLNGCATNCPTGQYFDGVTCRRCETTQAAMAIPACQADDGGILSSTGDDAGAADDAGSANAGEDAPSSDAGDDDAGPKGIAPVTSSPFPCPGGDGRSQIYLVRETCPEIGVDDWRVVDTIPSPETNSFPMPADGKCNTMGDYHANRDGTMGLKTPEAACDALAAELGNEAAATTNRPVPRSFDFCGNHYDCPEKKGLDLKISKTAQAGVAAALGTVGIVAGVKIAAGGAVLGGTFVFAAGVGALYAAWWLYRTRKQRTSGPAELPVVREARERAKRAIDKAQEKHDEQYGDNADAVDKFKSATELTPEERRQNWEAQVKEAPGLDQRVSRAQAKKDAEGGFDDGKKR